MFGQAAPVPTFEVAVIRPNNTNDGHTHIYKHPESGEFLAQNISLRVLMEFAYAMPQTRIVGGAGWVDSAHWDVQGKAGPEVDEHLKQLGSDASATEKQKMVQALLADRFQLKVHPEKRELPVYALVVARGGAKLGEVQQNGTIINRASDHIEVQGDNSADLLAAQLALTTGRVVLNQTGIAGRYNLKVKWAREGDADATGPSLFTAIQEQLGLKLETTTAPVDVMVIDNVAMPSAN
jgi:uncharacterized protein (TIGR03435 family)